MSIKLSGLDELGNRLNELAKSAEELAGTNSVSFDELFTAGFMRKHTKFSTFDELLDSSKFDVNSQEDFEAIPGDEFDMYIASVTDFEDWDSMLQSAGEDFLSGKLGF